jgi:hypothetical protein
LIGELALVAAMKRRRGDRAGKSSVIRVARSLFQRVLEAIRRGAPAAR